MSEKPAEAKSDTASPKLGTGDLSRVGLDDDVDKSLTADLEPTKFVARALFEHAPVAMLLVDQAGKMFPISA